MTVNQKSWYGELRIAVAPNGWHAVSTSYVGSTTFLEATGMPLGLFTNAEYETRTAVIRPGGALLLFTDGLTDSIPGEDPASRLRDAVADSARRTMSNLRSLVDPKHNEDDVTIVLVKRTADSVLR